MSRSTTNQFQIRARILTGSPKKNFASFSLLKKMGGTSPGLVMTYQTTKSTTRTPACQIRRFRALGRIAFQIVIRAPAVSPSCGPLLLRVALEHFLPQHVPYSLVQFDKARSDAHLGNITRPWQVDREFADRVGCGSGRKHDDAIAERDRLVEIVRDEQKRPACASAPGAPKIQQLVLHQLPRLDIEGRTRLSDHT